MKSERPMHFLDRLAEYYQGIADGFAKHRNASRVFPNNGDAGSSREERGRRFSPSKHLPKRCEVVKGGFIFDTETESKQIDIIITNDLTLQFREFEKSFNCVEGCYAAISVKTTFGKGDIFEALANIASVPNMPPVSTMPYLLAGPSPTQQSLRELPFRAIFAFDGAEVPTIMNHIHAYYAENPTPDDRRPHVIVVNNHCLIVRIGAEGAKNRGGQSIPPHTFHPILAENAQNLGAYSLVYLLTQIQKASNVGAHVLFDFGTYMDKIRFR